VFNQELALIWFPLPAVISALGSAMEVSAPA
jgi:hypothetical protein